jgi:transposase
MGYSVDMEQLKAKFLTFEQRLELIAAHRSQRERRYADRIKAILILDDGYSVEKTSQLLLLDETTIRDYLASYQGGGLPALTSDNYQPYSGKLTEQQEAELYKYLSEHVLLDVYPIILWVYQQFKIRFTPSGMRDLLHRIGFEYKKADHVPSKADPEEQRKWLEAFNKLMEVKSPKTPVYFIDAVHPTYNSQPAYGWIPKGKKAEIPANSGRQHINLHGAVNAETQEVIVVENEKMTGESSLELLKKIKEHHPDAPHIYVVLDRAPYHDSQAVRDFCLLSCIMLIYLPVYSPNLNIIERLWRFMYKHTLYNQYYPTFAEFRRELLFFFDRLSEEFSGSLRSLLNLKFSIASSKEERKTAII